MKGRKIKVELQSVHLQLSDKEYETRLAGFLLKNYQDTLELTEEAGQKTLLVTDAASDKAEEGERETEWLATVRLAVDGDIDPYQSGHEIAGALLKAAVMAADEKKRQQDLAAMEDNENKGPLWMTVPDEGREEAEDLRRKGRLLCITSPAGGIGTSLSARAFSSVMGEYGRTLHLDLNFPSDWPLFFTAEAARGGLSELIYSFLAESREKLDERIEDFITSQPEGIFFLRPVKDPGDLHALTEEEAAVFIDCLKVHFDHTVCDVGRGTDPFCKALLRESDDVCILTDGSETCEEKRKHYVPVTDRGRVWILLRTETETVSRGIISMGMNKRRRNVRCDIELPWEEDVLEEKEDKREGERKGVREGTAFLSVIREAVAAMG